MSVNVGLKAVVLFPYVILVVSDDALLPTEVKSDVVMGNVVDRSSEVDLVVVSLTAVDASGKLVLTGIFVYAIVVCSVSTVVNVSWW